MVDGTVLAESPPKPINWLAGLISSINSSPTPPNFHEYPLKKDNFLKRKLI